MDPVRLIELAVDHNISQWLEDAYVSLCTRSRPLTQVEVTRVGPTIAKKLGRCRAEVTMVNNNTEVPRTPNEIAELARKTVRQVFWPCSPVT